MACGYRGKGNLRQSGWLIDSLASPALTRLGRWARADFLTILVEVVVGDKSGELNILLSSDTQHFVGYALTTCESGLQAHIVYHYLISQHEATHRAISF